LAVARGKRKAESRNASTRAWREAKVSFSDACTASKRECGYEEVEGEVEGKEEGEEEEKEEGEVREGHQTRN